MLLAVNTGNTNITLGIFSADGTLGRCWRISSVRERTPDEYGIMLLGLLSSAGFTPGDLKGAVICSVVPELDDILLEAISTHLGTRPLFVGKDLLARLPVVRGNPEEVGMDRIVNAVAAYEIYKTSLIVIDLGTAITFDYVNEAGEYVGGPIAPGIGISLEALAERTAKLPHVELKEPSEIIGQSTVENIRAGVFYGFIGLVDGVVERMLNYLKTKPKVIATGGASPLISGHTKYIEEVDEFLTLRGLRILYEGR